MIKPTSELETCYEAGAGWECLAHSLDRSHLAIVGFQGWGSRVKHGFALPMGRFLLCNSSYHNEPCFTRFHFMRENTKCVYNHQDTWIKTTTESLEVNKMNIKNYTENISISIPDSRGASCT